MSSFTPSRSKTTKSGKSTSFTMGTASGVSKLSGSPRLSASRPSESRTPASGTRRGSVSRSYLTKMKSGTGRSESASDLPTRNTHTTPVTMACLKSTTYPTKTTGRSSPYKVTTVPSVAPSPRPISEPSKSRTPSKSSVRKVLTPQSKSRRSSKASSASRLSGRHVRTMPGGTQNWSAVTKGQPSASWGASDLVTKGQTKSAHTVSSRTPSVSYGTAGTSSVRSVSSRSVVVAIAPAQGSVEKERKSNCCCILVILAILLFLTLAGFGIAWSLGCFDGKSEEPVDSSSSEPTDLTEGLTQVKPNVNPPPITEPEKPPKVIPYNVYVPIDTPQGPPEIQHVPAQAPTVNRPKPGRKDTYDYANARIEDMSPQQYRQNLNAGKLRYDPKTGKNSGALVQDLKWADAQYNRACYSPQWMRKKPSLWTDAEITSGIADLKSQLANQRRPNVSKNGYGHYSRPGAVNLTSLGEQSTRATLMTQLAALKKVQIAKGKGARANNDARWYNPFSWTHITQDTRPSTPASPRRAPTHRTGYNGNPGANNRTRIPNTGRRSGYNSNPNANNGRLAPISKRVGGHVWTEREGRKKWVNGFEHVRVDESFDNGGRSGYNGNVGANNRGRRADGSRREAGDVFG